MVGYKDLHPVEKKLLHTIWGQNYRKHIRYNRCGTATVNGMLLEQYLSEQIQYRFK